MRLLGIIIAIKIIGAHSASRISLPIDKEYLPNAAVDIVGKCFISSNDWTTILIISGSKTPEIWQIVYQKFVISTLIVSLDTIDTSECNTRTENCDDYSNTTAEREAFKPNAVLIVIESPAALDSILRFYKNNTRKMWNPRSYIFVVLGGRCNVSDCSNMFKAIWNHWILNAFILCSPNTFSSWNQSEFEMYTFNPYSLDSSPGWELVINETIQLPIRPGNFTHSWAVFKKLFRSLSYSETCDDIFFRKESNLDGYLVPVGVVESESSAAKLMTDNSAQWRKIDWFAMKIVSRKLQFNFTMIPFRDDQNNTGHEQINGTISFVVGDAPLKRSLVTPGTSIAAEHHPRFGSPYMHLVDGICFVSRIAGPRPQWSNIADAKSIWIALGVCMLFLLIFSYMQNKSLGIMSAFLDSERLLTGSSVIHTSASIKYRIILGSILLTVLVIDGAVRGRLISTLTVVTSFPNLDSIRELKQHNVKLYGHIAYKNVIGDPQMTAQYVAGNSIFECLENLEEEKYKRACLTSCRSLPFVTSNVSDVHIASTPIMSNFVWSTKVLHISFMDYYSVEMLKTTETGLIDKYRDDYYRASGIGSWKLRMAVKPPSVKAIKLKDLLLAFMLLSLGLSAAFIAFAWEITSLRYFPRTSVYRGLQIHPGSNGRKTANKKL